MKTNVKALELIELGLSSKTVSKLTESQISVLHKKLVSEAMTQTTTTSYNIPTSDLEKGVSVPTPPAGKKMVIQKTNTGVKATPTEEVTEDETDDVTDGNALDKDSMQDYTGQEVPHDANDMAPDGMDDDSDNDRKMMGMSESEKTEKNPWAICHAQLGPRKNAKFESCVKQVKESLKEGKNPVTLFIEEKITKLVESYIPPKMTKKDLIKYINEAEPAVAPKPGVKEPKPGTKTPPKIRPSHPGKNPNPGTNPAPKAKNVEDAKDAIIDTIINILKNG
jgi:hypothetical protein